MQYPLFGAVNDSMIDYRKIFDTMPGNFLVLNTDTPYYTILSISDELLDVTGKKRESVTGKSILEIYPEDPGTSTAGSLIRTHVQHAIKHKKPTYMPVVRLDVANAEGKLEERYWRATNKPVLDENGEVLFIIHSSIEMTEQVKSERIESAVKQVEKTYHLFMQAPVAICITKGPEYIVELANESMLQFLGRTANIVGKPLLESLPEAKIQGLIDILDYVRNTGLPYYTSTFPATLLIDGNKELRYFDLIFTPYYLNASDTQVDGVFCAAHNVTEQVAARNKAKESEHRYRTLIEESSVATALYIGREIRIQYANDIMIGYWGKDQSVIGKTLREGLPELEAQPLPAKLVNVYETGVPYVGTEEKADIVLDGKLQSFYFNFTYKALRNKEGEIYGIHHMAVDVTREVVARKKLEEEKERTSLALSVGELGVIEIDWKAGEVIADKRCKEILGIEGEPLVSEYLRLIHPDDLAVRNRAIKEGGETGPLDYEARIAFKDGKVRWIRNKGFIYKDEAGTVFRSFGIIQDITEQKKFSEALREKVEERTGELARANEELSLANLELERSNKNLEAFAFAASHDMKEPIRKIYFFADRLKKRLEGKLDDEDRRLFDRMQTASKRMGKLIDDLLTYSHVSSGITEMEEIDLNEKVRKVLEDLELETQEKAAKITADPLPTIKGHRGQLQQLFHNLLSNALKYSKPGIAPEILVRSQLIKGSMSGLKLAGDEGNKNFHLIEVSDNGIGFDQQYAERIFNVFTRLHGNVEYPGTGVGLSIAQKVAANHKGHLWAESEAGKGATFKVLLPAE